MLFCTTRVMSSPCLSDAERSAAVGRRTTCTRPHAATLFCSKAAAMSKLRSLSSIMHHPGSCSLLASSSDIVISVNAEGTSNEPVRCCNTVSVGSWERGMLLRCSCLLLHLWRTVTCMKAVRATQPLYVQGPACSAMSDTDQVAGPEAEVLAIEGGCTCPAEAARACSSIPPPLLVDCSIEL